MTVTLALAAAGLFSIGTYLVLQRKLSRVIIGLALLSHGSNVLLLTSGRWGIPPLIGSGDPASFSDPLPQAMALTTIVITFGVSALLLALAFRSFLLTHDDEVEDDLTDRAVARSVRRDRGDASSGDKELVDEIRAEASPLPSEADESDDLPDELRVYVDVVERELDP